MGVLAVFALAGWAVSRGWAADPVALPKFIDFDHDIRPILSENCFACHGPDEQKRKGKLRLDIRDVALKPAKSG
ncbi:MAG TPA: c-type cytochrome domain-containing protein, partial [Tepidisphaeraceae bacterium]